MKSYLLRKSRAGLSLRGGCLIVALASVLYALAGGPLTGASGQGSAEGVVWVNHVGTSATGNTLQKVSGQWDSGANSQQQITEQGGYVEFSVSPNDRMQVGLSYDTSAAVDYTQLKYTFNFWGGEFDIREGWENLRLYGGQNAASDVFRIAVEGGVVKYYKNGALLYTSNVAPTGPLVLDTALTALGSTVQNALVYAPSAPPATPPPAGGNQRGISLDGVNDGGIITLPNSAPWNAMGDFEIAFRMRNAKTVRTHPHITSFTPQRILTHSRYLVWVHGDSDWLIVQDTSPNAQSAIMPIGPRTYFKIRHTQADGETTLEGWDDDGVNYLIRWTEKGATGPSNFSGNLGFGRDYDADARHIRADFDWLRWKNSAGPKGLRPLDCDYRYNLLRYEFEDDAVNSAGAVGNITLGGGPSFVDTPGSTSSLIVCAGEDQTAKPGQAVSFDASGVYSKAGPVAYSWTQVSGPAVSLTGVNTAAPSFTAPTPAGDNAEVVLRVTATDAGGSASDTVSVGVVKVDSLDRVQITDGRASLLIGPQVLAGSPNVPFTERFERKFNQELGYWIDRFPAIPPNRVKEGTVIVTQGSKTVTGIGTKFLSEIEMGKKVDERMARSIAVQVASNTFVTLPVESVNSDTQLTLANAYAGTSIPGGTPWHTSFVNPSDGKEANSIYQESSRYDLVLIAYQQYYRTGLTKWLAGARKVADSRWRSDFIFHGTVNEGGHRLPPYYGEMGGLIMRAVDGRPEFWDFLYRYVMRDFEFLVTPLFNKTTPQLIHDDTRSLGYTQEWAVMLSVLLPDDYLYYANGTHKPATGVALGRASRTELRGKVEDAALAFGRVQFPDGSWRWNIHDNSVINANQPYMDAIYLQSAVLLHQVTARADVKSSLREQLRKSCDFLWSTYGKTDPVTNPEFQGYFWRSSPYFAHGTEPATGKSHEPPYVRGNATTLLQGDGSVRGARFQQPFFLQAFGYLYSVTGEASWKEKGHDMTDSVWGDTDKVYWYGTADHIADKEKDFGEAYTTVGRYVANSLEAINAPPAAPSNLRQEFYVEGGGGQTSGVEVLRLRWNDNANNETTYRVERRSLVDGEWTLWKEEAVLGANADTFRLGGAKCSTDRFRIRATNAAGESAYSNEVHSHLLNCFFEAEPSSCTPAASLIISEFRLRGSAGPDDEFVELYNNSDTPVTVCTADRSGAWTVAAWSPSDASTKVVFSIPYGTVIPARGHYLGVNVGGYSLASHLGGAGDATYNTDLNDDSGIALFKTANPDNFTSANRLDAAGFSGATLELYREGAGLTPVGSRDGNHTFVRKMTSSLPQDTANNPSDFLFLATDGAIYGGVQAALGAPGPENLASPIQRNDLIKASLIDPLQSSGDPPNTVRKQCPEAEECVATRSQFGTFSIRRRWTNQTGASVTRLRFRVVDVTTFPAADPSTTADLRVISSADLAGVQITGGSTITVYGTTLEEPPGQPLGGGWNSTVGVGTITPSQPLAPGASINLQFLLGVQNPGAYRFFVNVEALP